ncbi:MAG: hypothetical protein LRZ84_27165 [Desertifilum sp.]|nr:hypothetical protein [Desertifilum sp.]
MNKVKQFGVFKEFRNLESDLSVLQYQHKNLQKNHEKIIKYLNSGVFYIAGLGVVRDGVSKENKIICPDHYLTDGCWVWPQELSYIVDKYNVHIPPDFLEYMSSKNWLVPKENEIDLVDLERRHFGEH